jgi:hypothetical protein
MEEKRQMMYDYFLHRIWKDFARFRKGESLEHFVNPREADNADEYRQLRNA